mmetsp:Transcript_26927/g.58104  ORF Transcript_26927/g.58104 Transcript_26927/m.58104 type:complete len:208 (+) Transcript_26927:315-938(+)
MRRDPRLGSLHNCVARDAVSPVMPALVGHDEQRTRLEQQLGRVQELIALVAAYCGLLKLHVDGREQRDGGDHLAEGRLIFEMGGDAEILHVLVHEDLRGEVAPMLSKDEQLAWRREHLTRCAHLGLLPPPPAVVELSDQEVEIGERVRGHRRRLGRGAAIAVEEWLHRRLVVRRVVVHLAVVLLPAAEDFAPARAYQLCSSFLDGIY